MEAEMVGVVLEPVITISTTATTASLTSCSSQGPRNIHLDQARS